MFNLPLTSCRFKPRGLCHSWLVYFVYKLRVLIRYNKNFRNYWLMTTQPDRYQTNVSPSIYQTLRTNNKTNFEKLLGQRVFHNQTIAIRFKLLQVCRSIPPKEFSVIYLLLTFLTILFVSFNLVYFLLFKF